MKIHMKINIRKRIAIYIILPCLLVMGGFLFAQEAKAETNVSGIISEDTSWRLVNSPYIVINDLTIQEGIKLIIEPSVVVKFDGYYRLKVRGTLEARGTELNTITFTSNKTTANDSILGKVISHPSLDKKVV